MVTKEKVAKDKVAKKMRIAALLALIAASALVAGCGGGYYGQEAAPVAPAAPSGLTATAGNAQVALSWSASATASSFNVYYSTAADVTTANGTKVGSIAATSYTQSSLSNGIPYYFIVTAVNAAGESAPSIQVSATPAASVAVSPLSVTTASLPSGTVNAVYTTTSLAASGGTAPDTWSISTGSLPTGITLAPSTGILSGTPTASGTFNFTVQVNDSEATPATATANLSITINPATLSVTTTSLPSGTVNAVYTTTSLAASGGTAPYTWSISTGSLPTGITLAPSTGILSGTPAASGTFNFTVQVNDSEATPVTASTNLSITINPAAAPSLSISSVSLPTGEVNTAYSFSLNASGGTAPYIWSISSGLLPAGLSISPTGIISGTPTQFQNSTFTIQVQDSEATPKTATLQASIAIYSGLEITTKNFGYTLINTSFSASPRAVGGSAPYTWTFVSGSLPPGITLDSFGDLTGTATASGTYLFQLQVQDSETTPAILTANFSISVLATIPVSLSPTSLMAGTVGVAMNEILWPTNNNGLVPLGDCVADSYTGNPPYNWTVVSGSLPAGLSLVQTATALSCADGDYTYAIVGTPTIAGTAAFSLQVVDGNNNTATAAYTLAINPVALTVNTTYIEAGNIGLKYNTSNIGKVTGGIQPYTYALTSGVMPPGLTFNTSDGAISGTPTTIGAFPFTMTVTDGASNIVSQAFTLNVFQDAPCPTGNESELNGSYAFAVRGFTGYGLGYPEAAAVSFTANGAGGITSGEGDVNSATGSATEAYTFTSASSYSVGANGIGCMTLVGSNGSGSFTFAFSLGGVNAGVASKGRIISFDAAAEKANSYVSVVSPNHTVAVLSGGEIEQQSPSDFDLSKLDDSFAFGLTGNDSSLGHFGFVGSLSNSVAGSFSNVFGDTNDNGTVQSNLSGGSGGFTSAPDAHGRAFAKISIGGNTYNYVAYIVSADAIFLVSSDGIAANPITTGTLLKSLSSYSNSAASGNYIFGGVGSAASYGGSGFWTIGVLGFNSNDTSYSGVDYRFESNCPCVGRGGARLAISGTYTVDSSSGRVALTQTGAQAPVIYLTDPATNVAGFFLDTTTGLGATAFEGQAFTQPNQTYSASSLSGTFALSSGTQASNQDGSGVGQGVFAAGGAAVTLDATSFSASAGAADEQGADEYGINADGTGTFGPVGDLTALVTNGNLAYIIDLSASSGAFLVLDQF